MKCLLCKKDAPLQKSHVIPAFIFRWHRKTAAMGFLRSGDNPNRRVQDGPKREWLCSECEMRLGEWERRFAQDVFRPYTEDRSLRIRYGDWMLPFCVSVSWRVTHFFLEREREIPHFSETQVESLHKALEKWRLFLLGECQHPAGFEQHVVPLDIIESTSIQEGVLPPNINRYFVRATDMDLAAASRSAFVLSKLGPMAVIGFFTAPERKYWRDTRVGVQTGLVGNRDLRLPAYFMNYLIDRATKAHAMMDQVSSVQGEKIESDLVARIDELLDNNYFEAAERDLQMFGKSALRKKPS